MDFLNKVLSSVTEAFDFNDATLSGCVDIVVVQQPDGSFRSTPFHVRMGKLKVMKSKEQVLKIHVNNRETGLRMKLGEAGEGFFEEEVLDIYESPSFQSPNKTQQQTSPLVIPGDSKVHPATPNQEQPLGNGFFGNLMDRIDANSSPGEKDQKYDNLKGLLGLGNGKTSAETKVEDNQYNPVLSEIAYTEGGRSIKKTLRPNSDSLRSLKLNLGMNTITYIVETNLQGTQIVNGHIYLWPYDAKIVVSDVDGTITKSDFLGHFMATFGQDWSQPGIAPLYSNVRRNGYYMMYLTSRAIGQSQTTKDFIYAINQDGKTMPQGPVIMSPDQLLPSIKREVIFKRPELFKVATLRDLRKLFPENYNPFYAGFGNRETDAIAYRSVGIGLEHIYIVDPKGDIIQYHHDTPRSYSMLNSIIKDLFPIITKTKENQTRDKPNFFSFRADNSTVEANIGKITG